MLIYGEHLLSSVGPLLEQEKLVHGMAFWEPHTSTDAGTKGAGKPIRSGEKRIESEAQEGRQAVQIIHIPDSDRRTNKLGSSSREV